MKVLSARSILLGLCMSGIVVSASRSLSLYVAGPNSVDGVDALKITTSLQNTGDETLRILKDPRGVLSTFPTETFSISDVQGVTPSFTGVKIKFVPEQAAQLESYVVVLKPGQSIQVQHDLSAAYNFTLPGEGLYDIHADSLFQIVDPATNQLADIRASQEASFKVNLKGKLAATRRSSGIAKRATYRSCSSTQQSQLTAAATAAANYANSASSYLNSLNSSSPRYTTWFGTYLTPNKDTVTNHFTAIKGYSFSGETYDCSCTDTGVFAYVYPDEYGVIYLCGAFWSAPVTGTDSKGGTLVHESSHFTAIAGTQDKAYGQSNAQLLAVLFPNSAIQNADSHEYFAENNPALT